MMKQKESQFLKMPTSLLDSELSLYALVLYTILLDRSRLSRQNQYQDKQGIYVFCTLEEAKRFLRCSKPRAIQTFDELCDAGYLSKKRLGRMHSKKYYIKEIDFKEVSTTQSACPDRSECEIIAPKSTPFSNKPLPEGKSFDINELDLYLRQHSNSLPSEVKCPPLTSKNLTADVKNSDPNQNYIKHNYVSQTDINHADAKESEQESFRSESDPELRKRRAMKQMQYFPRLFAGESKAALNAELEALLT